MTDNLIGAGLMPGGQELIIILLIVFLLFGASRLPQLAKALGQSKRAFREGINEADAEAERKQLNRDGTAAPSQLSGVDDETLFEEARRRAAQQKASEKS